MPNQCQQSFLADLMTAQLDGRDTALLEADARGAVFTRREVVEFILDVVGYTPDRLLAMLRVLEPSIGQGDFFLAALDRLIAALRSPEDRSVAQLSEYTEVSGMTSLRTFVTSFAGHVAAEAVR